jgi:beta-lactamase class A
MQRRRILRFPLLSEEGWLRGQIKRCAATLFRADGVATNLQHFVPHHPALRAPLLGEEGKTPTARYAWFSTILLICFSTIAWSADLAALRAQIEKVIPRARGEVGVAIRHVESGTELLVNGDKTYPMASTYKVPILVEIFYQRSEGKLTLDERIEVNPSDVHPGGTIALLLDGPGLQMSIHNLIQLMMRVSDNSATDILLAKVGGAANVTARMKSLGLDSIRVDRSTLEMIMDQEGVDYATYGKLPIAQLRERMAAVDAQTAARANEQFNKTEKDVASPRHMTALLDQIYRGQIVDRASSDEIIEFMSHSMVGQARIPGLLPDGTRVVYKTGSISGSSNATGIIYLPKGDHLVVTVFTRDAKASPGERERVIAEISRYAYDYFLANPTGQ